MYYISYINSKIYQIDAPINRICPAVLLDIATALSGAQNPRLLFLPTAHGCGSSR